MLKIHMDACIHLGETSSVVELSRYPLAIVLTKHCHVSTSLPLQHNQQHTGGLHDL